MVLAHKYFDVQYTIDDVRALMLCSHSVYDTHHHTEQLRRYLMDHCQVVELVDKDRWRAVRLSWTAMFPSQQITLALAQLLDNKQVPRAQMVTQLYGCKLPLLEVQELVQA